MGQWKIAKKHLTKDNIVKSYFYLVEITKPQYHHIYATLCLEHFVRQEFSDMNSFRKLLEKISGKTYSIRPKLRTAIKKKKGKKSIGVNAKLTEFKSSTGGSSQNLTTRKSIWTVKKM